MNDDQNLHANNLIPKLITNSNTLTKNLNDRLKVGIIFSEFEDETNKNFNKFVELSNKRYKIVKTGSNIENALTKQEPDYQSLEKKIKNYDVYNNLDEIGEEKNKLLKNMNEKKIKELNEIRGHLRLFAKGFTKAELNKRRKLEEKVMNNKKNNVPLEKNKNNYIKNNEALKIINEKVIISNDEMINERENFVNELMEKDNDYLKNKFDLYGNVLKDISISAKIEDKKLANKKIQNSLEGCNVNFKVDKFNLISYVEKKEQVTKVKVVKDDNMDINKLMRFTKKGKERMRRLHYDNVLKELENKKNSYIGFNTDNSEKLDTVNVIQNEVYNSKNLKNKLSLKKQNLYMRFEKTMPNFNKSKKDFQHSKYSIDLDKSRNINQYNNTKSNFNLNDFNNIQNNKGSSNDNSNIYINTNNSSSNNTNPPHSNFNITTNKLKLTENSTFFDRKLRIDPTLSLDQKYKKTVIDNKLNFKDLCPEFEKIYNEKKNFWKVKDKDIDVLKRYENLKLMETNNFLKSIKNLERKDQLFIDGYSLREYKTNKEIKEFNELLGNDKYYNKKKLNEKLEKFIEAKQQIKEHTKQLQELEEKNMILQKKAEMDKKINELNEFRKKINSEYENNQDIKLGSKAVFKTIKKKDEEKDVDNNYYKEYLLFKEKYKEKEDMRKREEIMPSIFMDKNFEGEETNGENEGNKENEEVKKKINAKKKEVSRKNNFNYTCFGKKNLLCLEDNEMMEKVRIQWVH